MGKNRCVVRRRRVELLIAEAALGSAPGQLAFGLGADQSQITDRLHTPIHSPSHGVDSLLVTELAAKETQGRSFTFRELALMSFR